MRLFVALGLPPEYQTVLEDLRREWEPCFRSRLKWTKPENWHLTLKFIGEQEQEVLPDICYALDEVDVPSLTLAGHDGGFFSAKGKVKVAWVSLQGDTDRLSALADSVDKCLEPLGIASERRPFRPHLTLFRVKSYESRDPWQDFREELCGLSWPQFNVSHIQLWKSILTRQGPVYEQVHTVPGEQIREDSRHG